MRQSLGAAALWIARAEPAVGAVVCGRTPAIGLVAVDVLLDFGVRVHAGAEGGGGVDVEAHYEVDWRVE